jgi:hypothetical protein
MELGISRCYLHRLLNQFNLAAEEVAQEELEQEQEQENEPTLREFPIQRSESKRPRAIA